MSSYTQLLLVECRKTREQCEQDGQADGSLGCSFYHDKTETIINGLYLSLLDQKDHLRSISITL